MSKFSTGRARLIRSHSSPRISFKISEIQSITLIECYENFHQETRFSTIMWMHSYDQRYWGPKSIAPSYSLPHSWRDGRDY